MGTGGRHPVRPGPWRDCQLDLTSPAALRSLLEREQPGTVVFCAYDRTNRAVTVDAPARAAAVAAQLGARFVFISTDLVFDGETGHYTETDRPAPLLAYGALKAEAELQVRSEHPSAVVVRASLFVGESGVMRRPAYECEALARGRPVTLYRDEWRSPTHVDDVARAAWDLAAREVVGTFHVAGPDRLSRAELGQVLCALFQFDARLLREGARPPDRPRDTSLDGRHTAALLGWTPRSIVALARRAPAPPAHV
jgi:dTDP-4-dehydrorhamnose reductase